MRANESTQCEVCLNLNKTSTAQVLV